MPMMNRTVREESGPIVAEIRAVRAKATGDRSRPQRCTTFPMSVAPSTTPVFVVDGENWTPRSTTEMASVQVGGSCSGLNEIDDVGALSGELRVEAELAERSGRAPQPSSMTARAIASAMARRLASASDLRLGL